MSDDGRVETLNVTGNETTPEVVDSSSANMNSADGLTSTLDMYPTNPEEIAPAAKAEETKADVEAKAKEEAETKAAAEAAEKAKSQEKETPFHEHPRFKEIISDRDTQKERAIKAEAKNEELEKRILALEKGGKAEESSILSMNEEEIREAFDSDPKGFLADYGKLLRSEILEEVNTGLKTRETEASTKALEDQISSTLDSYANSHEDFIPMWESGELQEFMNKNPYAIAAHMALTQSKDSETQKADIQKRIDDAVKQAEDKMIANIKAKGVASVLGDGPSATVVNHNDNAELKDTSKSGGLIATQMRRLLSLRAAKT